MDLMAIRTDSRNLICSTEIDLITSAEIRSAALDMVFWVRESTSFENDSQNDTSNFCISSRKVVIAVSNSVRRTEVDGTSGKSCGQAADGAVDVALAVRTEGAGGLMRAGGSRTLLRLAPDGKFSSRHNDLFSFTLEQIARRAQVR